MIGVKIPVLDHGFIIVRDYMGVDKSIADAARVSYGDGTRTVNDDAGLISYLMEHNHGSPFEMCEIKIHVKLPIFVARQWIRHRTANVNEYSGRYSIMDTEFYLPEPEEMCEQSTTNKQGSGKVLSYEDAKEILQILKSDALRCQMSYNYLLNTKRFARESARANITLNHYTQWVWKCDLRNLLHFIKLRMDSHAQLEIRRYAEEIWRIVQAWVPAAANAFEEHQLYATHFSRMESAILQEIVNQDGIKNKIAHLKPRQQAAFLLKLGL